MRQRAVEPRAVSGSARTGTCQHGIEATPRVLDSRRFGPLEVRPEAVIRCPSGLLGFEEIREYILVQPDGLEPLSFLVACENPDVAFPVLAGELCQPGYAPAIPTHVLETVGAATRQELEILAICTMAPDTGTLHANLRGPVVLNPTSRLACQVALDDSAYSLRHLLGGG
jgi:flagellar assembly factor FliW